MNAARPEREGTWRTEEFAGLTVERLIELADEYARTEITEPLTATLRVRHFARWLAPRLSVPGAPPAARRDTPSKAAIEAAAHVLWQMGNLRIGERPWETVGAHYLREAEAALRAALAAPAVPPEQTRGDPQDGDLRTTVRRYLGYIADVRTGRVQRLDRDVVLNYAQAMERHL